MNSSHYIRHFHIIGHAEKICGPSDRIRPYHLKKGEKDNYDTPSIKVFENTIETIAKADDLFGALQAIDEELRRLGWTFFGCGPPPSCG